MKKIVLCFMLSFALMTFPVMAEENKETVSVEETEEAASAAEQNDTVKNLLSKAKALLEEKKYEEAVPFLRKAADQGNAKAMYGLGLLYDLGTGVDKDLEAAAQWYQKALDAGFEPRDEEELLYAEVGIREGDVKVDYIVSADGQSRDVFEAAFPKCDEFDGTSYIYRNGGLGRKSKLVPGLTEYLNAHPHE